MHDKFVAFSGAGHRLGGSGYGNVSPTGQAHNERQSRALYQPQNVTGFTGRLGHDPTVYYHSGDVFGHITQAHDIPENVGREMPISDPTYTATNTGPLGELEERSQGRVFHTSRNPLVGATPTTTPSLVHAHTAFPELKPLTDPKVYAAVMKRIDRSRRRK